MDKKLLQLLYMLMHAQQTLKEHHGINIGLDDPRLAQAVFGGGPKQQSQDVPDQGVDALIAKVKEFDQKDNKQAAPRLLPASNEKPSTRPDYMPSVGAADVLSQVDKINNDSAILRNYRDAQWNDLISGRAPSTPSPFHYSYPTPNELARQTQSNLQGLLPQSDINTILSRLLERENKYAR